MDRKGYRHIPRALLDTITFLAAALPKRSVPTWVELLFGAMLTQTGFVTDAWLAIKPRRLDPIAGLKFQRSALNDRRGMSVSP
jgi:hypothetical protein